MKNLSLARRYARALYELAHQTKTLDDVLLSMSNIHLAFKSSESFQKVLKNPLIKADEKETLVRSITSNKLVLKFMVILSKRKRMDLFNLVYEVFQGLADLDKGIHRLIVKTAVALTDQDKRNVEKSLAQSLGGSAIGQFEVAKELIGGVWIKLGDKVLDATLRGRIDNLRHLLVHSTN